MELFGELFPNGRNARLNFVAALMRRGGFTRFGEYPNQGLRRPADCTKKLTTSQIGALLRIEGRARTA